MRCNCPAANVQLYFVVGEYPVLCVKNSLVLGLEMFLHKAVLDSGLLGLGRVRRWHFVSSTGTLQHRGGEL